MTVKIDKEKSSNKPAPTRMNLKDVLSLFFSALALLISAVGYYVANVRVQDAVTARITDVDVDATTPSDHVSGYRNGFLNFKVAFINSGNRQAIIDLPVYQLNNRADLESGGFGGEVDAGADAFPFVLAPKEIRLLPVRIPVASLLGSFDSGLPIQAPPGRSDGMRRFFAGFRYNAIDSAGARHTAWSGMQIVIDMSARGWEGMRPVRTGTPSEPQFPPTSLFKD